MRRNVVIYETVTGQNMDKIIKTKEAPKSTIESVQFDLFGQFLTNDKADNSNTVRIWERIPKYFPAKTLQKHIPKEGHPSPYEWEYSDNGQKYTVIIQPALIKEKGEYKAFFPSSTEEIIEEVLKKFLTNQQYGIHDPNQAETWVRFSLSMVYREMKSRGCQRNRNEIKRAIQIMSKCNVSLYKDHEEVWTGAILQDLVTVGRKDYIEDSDAHHIARMPLFISHSINQLDYRQFNYDRLMHCKSQLTRWIYKKLIHDYRHASMMNTYHFMYSTLKNSGLIQQSREIDNRKKVISSLEELVKSKVVLKYEVDEKKAGRKIVDVKYTVTATPEFTKEQKAANKRLSDHKTKAINSGIEVLITKKKSSGFISHLTKK